MNLQPILGNFALILFVLMLLGVDEDEDLDTEPIVGQRIVAVLIGLVLAALVLIVTPRGTIAMVVAACLLLVGAQLLQNARGNLGLYYHSPYAWAYNANPVATVPDQRRIIAVYGRWRWIQSFTELAAIKLAFPARHDNCCRRIANQIGESAALGHEPIHP